MTRVRITKLPSGKPGGLNPNVEPFKFQNSTTAEGKPSLSVKNTLSPTTKENANVEAEKGEVVVTNYMKDGIPELYTVGGKRHSKGGTPLNLPENSFVFSRDNKMKISDPNVLSLFNKGGKKSYTPADIAKQYKLNDYRKVLQDPMANAVQKQTAEMMIQKYMGKLGALSLVQESHKGFPDGIPAVAMGFMETNGIRPEDLVNPSGVPAMQAPSAMKNGGSFKPHVMYAPGTGEGIMASSYLEHLRLKDMGYSHRKSSMKKRGKLQKMQKGGQPSTTSKPTKVQNIPDDAVRWDETAEGYDETQIKPGHYVKKADGRWYQVAGYKAAPYEYDFADSRLSGKAGDLQEAYGRLEQMLLSPNNEALRNDLISQYRKNLKSTKPNSKTGLTQRDIDAALNLSDEEVLNNFLEMQKQVFAVNASGIGGKGMDSKDSWDKDRSNYVDTVTSLGFEPLQPWQQAAFQAAYIGLNELSDKPDHKELLDDFRMAQEGRDDENLSGLRTGSISQIDGWVGNTTIGQGAIYKPVLEELDLKEVPEEEVPVKKSMRVPSLEVLPDEPTYAPWWLQDIIKTSGAAADMARIQRAQPWQASPGLDLPEPTFFDPTRELAANAEQYNIGTQALSSFAGPQGFNARMSQLQGKAAQNAANIMARYNNMNVQVANQFEQNKSNLLNQASLIKSNLATQLYDKSIIADQQFQNAKNMARQNLRQSYIDAITNRAQTQTLNELYPQYNVDPITGGFLNFTKGREMVPGSGAQLSIADKFQEYKSMNPGISDDVIYKMAAADMGVSASTPVGVDPSYFGNYSAMLPR